VTRSDLAPGLLLLMLGLFVILRSVSQDATGRTLIDRILGKRQTPTVAAAATPKPTAKQIAKGLHLPVLTAAPTTGPGAVVGNPNIPAAKK
jgi:hypothetical protein